MSILHFKPLALGFLLKPYNLHNFDKLTQKLAINTTDIVSSL